jgi:hypothetical protein
MMKLLLCVALCAFATALPSADVDAATVVPESAPEAPDTNLMEASYNDAKNTVTALLQEGKDDSACRDMAKATADEVTASVENQQKQLAAMDNGDSCNDEGQGLIDTANKNQEEADKAKTDANKALNEAKSEKFNFGDFDYNSLTEGQCGTFFNSQTWKDAKGKVTAAQSTYNTKVAEANAAAKAVQTAKDEAKTMVKECKCKAKRALDDALESLNKNAKEANTKAWNKAYHMQCVLDGKTTNNCDVPALPTVQAVPYGDGVEHACGCKYPPFHGDECKAPRFGGQGAANDLFDPGPYLWNARSSKETGVWECGDGLVNGKKQQFMLSRIYIGRRLSTLDDWKQCVTKDGWRPLCDFKGACQGGATGHLGGLWPSKCGLSSKQWHNGLMPNAIHHPHRSGTTAWQNYDASTWKYSLQSTSGMRNDGANSGYAAATYPTKSWQAAGSPNSIMCILPLNNCEKGECGFTG